MHRDLGLEHLEQVPGNGLAFTVTVSCEIKFVGVLQGCLELGNLLLLVRGHHVVRLKVVVQIHRELADGCLLQLGRQVGGLRQVPDMAHRSRHLKALPQIAGNGLAFGGRLDND